MTTFAWPGWQPSAFEMRVIPNGVTFTSVYSKTTQAIDFLGERWAVKLDLAPGIDNIQGAAQEAFFDRLRGPVNLISMWNLRRPVPNGSIRGSPTLSGSIAQLANTMNIYSTAYATLRAGDQLGISGQLVRVMADIVADVSGLFTGVEFLPRIRASAGVSSGAAISWSMPTASFMLKADGVPTIFRPGAFDGASIDLIEAY